jgi:hypothetical protein
MIVIAVFALSVAHPGWVFKTSMRKVSHDGIESPPVDGKYYNIDRCNNRHDENLLAG